MWTTTESPVGELRIVASGGAVTAIEFDGAGAGGGVDGAARPASSVARARRAAEGRPRGDRVDDAPVLVDACTQLAEYFNRSRTTFDLPLAPDGTDFQQRVWAALREIEYGETASYGEIAQRLGMTGAASRAVGLANGRNPIPIVVPCHRVVGADGSLTGYAGGVGRKQLLLDLEQDALFTLA